MLVDSKRLSRSQQKFRVRCRGAITTFLAGMVPSPLMAACTLGSRMFLPELGSGSQQPPALQTCILADAFTVMPVLSQSPAPSSRCFFSLWTGPVVITQGVSPGDLVPPAAWGSFFLQYSWKRAAECSCCGSGYEEGQEVLWRWLILAL